MSDIEVKVGQVWKDMDPRMSSTRFGRVVRIEKTTGLRAKATMEMVTANGRPLIGTTRVDTRYMRGRVADGRRSGWSLVEDAS